MSNSPTGIERAQFEIQTRQALSAAQHNARQVGLLMIGFEGDEHRSGEHDPQHETALVAIASALRDSDVLYRIAPRETAILLSSLAGPQDALLVADKILQKLDQAFSLHKDKSDFQPQIGLAMFPTDAHNVSSLLECADLARRSALENRQRCVLYSSQASGSPRPPLHLRELRQAIVKDQLFVLYQPKIDLRNDRITGVEALTRWRHPTHGLIMPDEFIPLAERTGLIIPLTLWVLKQAVGQCRHWRSEGIKVSVAVNLSMWNLDTPELPEQIASILNNAKVPPGQLELEITESAIMEDPQRVMRTLKAIRELGVQFAIDDFGTGYSSLAHLKKMPVSSVKIDKSFTQSMETDNDSAVIVRAIIELGHNLGLKVVAEGVENLAAKEMLAGFGCDEAQGYYFGRPVTANDISRLLLTPQPPWASSPGLSNTRPPHQPEDTAMGPAVFKPTS